MDDIKKLEHRRAMPAELEAIAEQMLLNLVLADDSTAIMVTIDDTLMDIAHLTRERAKTINERFDHVIAELGFPEGTGRLL